MSENWSTLEVELIIADYFSLLEKDLAGVKFNKSEYRKKLLPLLPKRSDSSLSPVQNLIFLKSTQKITGSIEFSMCKLPQRCFKLMGSLVTSAIFNP
jgi:hypothetical protein